MPIKSLQPRLSPQPRLSHPLLPYAPRCEQLQLGEVASYREHV